LSDQVCRHLVKPATEEEGLAKAVQITWHTVTRAEAQIDLKMLESEVGLAGKDPQQAAPVPPASEARVEAQAVVHQPDRDIDVLAGPRPHAGVGRAYGACAKSPFLRFPGS
jgi:hypothetical protein